jgi:hypothetical protein
VSGAKSTMTVGKFFKADPCDAERLGNRNNVRLP